MIAGTIWNQLVTTLQENVNLAKYVKYVYEGRRYDMEPDALPCIMLEPVSNAETQRDMNQIKDLYFNVDIYAFSNANYHQFPKTIVCGQTNKGILDIENDIRGCLVSSNTLGDKVIDIRLEPSLFDLIDTDKYPVRGMRIPIKILYRQNNGV